MDNDLQRVLNQFPGKPYRHINDSLKSVIEHKKLIFDIYTHVFAKESVAETYFKIRLPFTTHFINRLKNILYNLCWWSDSDRLSHTVYFLEIIITNNEQDIATQLF